MLSVSNPTVDGLDRKPVPLEHLKNIVRVLFGSRETGRNRLVENPEPRVSLMPAGAIDRAKGRHLGALGGAMVDADADHDLARREVRRDVLHVVEPGEHATLGEPGGPIAVDALPTLLREILIL